MDQGNQHRRIIEIVIGSAWADRHLEPGEVAYLQKLLVQYHLDHDRELLALLQTPVSLEQTTQWMVAYLMDSTDTERLQLLAAIGNVLIADNEVSEQDHNLLDEYHNLMAQIPAHSEAMPTLIETVGKFFRRVTRSVRELASGH